ncbi:MAG: tetratricopeptide repeat protein, partial [Anaerolineales bacterium]|nr:tetratricopeptide repeat protein [Anaerolineales bacterium]
GLTLADTINHSPNVAIALNNLGTVYRLQGALSEAESLYHRALGIAQHNNLHRLECYILLDLTELWRDMDQKRAHVSGQQALQLAREMGNPHMLERANELVQSLAIQDDLV